MAFGDNLLQLVSASLSAKQTPLTLLQEEPLLRVPCESMRKTFKTAQRVLEKNIEQTAATCKTLQKTTQTKDTTNADGELPAEAREALAQVDGMLTRMQGLKRKMSQLRDEQTEHVARTRVRLDFLGELGDAGAMAGGPESDAYKRWSRRRLEMMITEHLLRTGRVQTALRHARGVGVAPLVDVAELTACHAIETSLRADHSVDLCQAWCQDNRPFLKKVRSSLEFEIKLQQFIELARAGRRTDAIQYYRQQLVRSHSDTNFEVMRQVSALLAFPPDQDVEPYTKFYADSRWDLLADMFVETFQDLHGLPTRSAFVRHLAAGISVLKTHSCHLGDDADDESTAAAPGAAKQLHRDLSRAYMCPVCSVELRKLAVPLPYAMHVTSHLEPDPVVLPNNRIYGLAKLKEYSRRVTGGSSDHLVDPVTEEVFGSEMYTMVFPT